MRWYLQSNHQNIGAYEDMDGIKDEYDDEEQNDDDDE